MNIILRAGVLVTAFLSGGTVLADERTVTLSVGNMYCEVCSLLLEKKLTEVPGVSAVDVSYANKTAKITFDDEKTNVDAFGSMCTELGYTSQVVASPPE